MSKGIRIIGGKWRSRYITVPHVGSVRPTPNRVRETLFNWLMHDIVDAICLDAFAGSGALGFEALSRGAKSVTFIDAEPRVIKALTQTAQQLGTDSAKFILGHFPNAIPSEQKYHMVFLDPPFRKNLVSPCIEALIAQNILAAHAFIYTESERSAPVFAHEKLKLLKEKLAGQVRYCLYQFQN